ncbi:MAG: SsrA-binding protein SmpB [Lachnospiraceae bacterium]|nr:SsrA-binding protein SmpB [Lachnospiraceae bacterium]
MAKEFKMRLIAQNKKAYHEYFIDETFQAGIALVGTEVKSLREGKCSLKESYIKIEGREAYIHNMNISPYEKGNIFNKDPLRTRKLLLHKSEINKILGAITATGYTVVPLKIYFDGSLVKLDIAIAKGKKIYDKRESIAKSDQRRQAEKEFKIQNLNL